MTSLSSMFRSIMLRLTPAATALLIMIAPAFAKSVTVESVSVNIRSGPGNYYEVIYTAGQGAKLEVLKELESWYKIALPDEKSGYVSIRSLQKRTGSMMTESKSWLKDKGVGKVASSEIMAATKGIVDMGSFAQAYASKHEIDPALLERYDTMPFTPEEYEQFHKTLKHRRNVRTPELSEAGIGEYDRELGNAIALRLASRGMYDDEDLRKYISLVGTAVVEQTPLYDENFVFIVLDDPQVRSFATPGGYVFVTTGALKLMHDEAELAGVLGHEVVHVVQRHGITELEKQRTRIQSEQLIEDLDSEVEKLNMDQGDRAVQQDLEHLADQMFEELISGRKKKAEEESDRLGTVIIYNTGYESNGLMDFIRSTEKLEKDHKDPSLTHDAADTRVKLIETVIEKKRLTRRDRKKFEGRFEENVK